MDTMKQRLLLMALLASGTIFAGDDGFDFDDLAAVEAIEQQDLLNMATQAANGNDFSQAQSLIEQAERKAYAPDDVARAKTILATAEAKKQREDEEKRQKALAAQRQQQSSGGSASYSDAAVDFVIVEGKVNSGLAFISVKNITLSGGTGNIQSSYSSSSNVSINKGVNEQIAGTYQYSIQLDNDTICSGNVYIDGKHKWVTITVDSSSCSAYVSQY